MSGMDPNLIVSVTLQKTWLMLFLSLILLFPLAFLWDLWDHLHTTSAAFMGPWLVMGDFDSIISQSEKIGGFLLLFHPAIPLLMISMYWPSLILDSMDLISHGIQRDRSLQISNKDWIEGLQTLFGAPLPLMTVSSISMPFVLITVSFFSIPIF